MGMFSVFNFILKLSRQGRYGLVPSLCTFVNRLRDLDFFNWKSLKRKTTVSGHRQDFTCGVRIRYIDSKAKAKPKSM